MGILSVLPRLFSRKSVTGSIEIFRELLAGYRSKSGASVTWKTAIEASAVLACARVIAEGLAQVPLKVFRELPDSSKQPARDLPLYDVLQLRPNEVQTAYELRETMGLHLSLAGNFYAFINRVQGQVVELLPFEPGNVTVERAAGWDVGYKVRMEDGTNQPIPRENMLHIRGPSWNSWKGLDATRIARESIGLALTMEEHASRFFSNGAQGGDLLSTDLDLKPDQVERLKQSWKENYAGTENAYKTAIMWGGIKWQSRTTDNKLSQLYELRGQQVEDICQRMRVNPIMIGFSGDKTPTYASAEQLFIAHAVHTLGPWFRRVEQALAVNLLSEDQRRAGYYIKHIDAGLMRGSHKDRAEYFSRALGSGGAPAWMTQDEVRGLDELNPMGGAAADLPIATNLAPVPPAED